MNKSSLPAYIQAEAKTLGAASPKEFIGKPVLQIIHPDYHEIIKKRIHTQEGSSVTDRRKVPDALLSSPS